MFNLQKSIYIEAEFHPLSSTKKFYLGSASSWSCLPKESNSKILSVTKLKCSSFGAVNTFELVRSSKSKEVFRFLKSCLVLPKGLIHTYSATTTGALPRIGLSNSPFLFLWLASIIRSVSWCVWYLPRWVSSFSLLPLCFPSIDV